MDVITSPHAYRAAMNLARSGGASVGFVPTMGALHAGHLSLLRRARVDADHLAMSIFVNPLQFGPTEDLASYPRPIDRDLGVAEQVGCDTVFTPTTGDMYPNGPPAVTIDPGPVGDRLEGASRPGHFRGVLTVVSKLFHLTGPSRSYFGEKDAQQVYLVRSMARDLDIPVEVIACSTIRDRDGLAMSSRNAHLSLEQRGAAACLSQALQYAVLLAAAGEGSRDALADAMRERIASEPLAALDYSTVVNDRTWDEPETLERPARAVVAARFGRVRLIDNALLPVGGAS